jgi:hypothetical protein
MRTLPIDSSNKRFDFPTYGSWTGLENEDLPREEWLSPPAPEFSVPLIGSAPGSFALGTTRAQRETLVRRLALVHREMGLETWSAGAASGDGRIIARAVPEPVRLTSAICLVVHPGLRIPSLGDFRRWAEWTRLALRGDYSAPDFDPPRPRQTTKIVEPPAEAKLAWWQQ